MTHNFSDFINNFKLVDDLDPNITYDNVYDNYMCSSINELPCDFDQIVLDPYLTYKKVEESTFEEQWNYLLKEDIMVKSRINVLKKKINNYLFSNITDNIPIVGNITLSNKLDKIKSDFNILNGILNIEDIKDLDKNTIAKQYYDNLKGTYEYELINHYYSENYSICKNTIIRDKDEIVWKSTDKQDISVRMAYYKKELGSTTQFLYSSIQIYIRIGGTLTTYKIVENEEFQHDRFPRNPDVTNIKYIILPILQIIHNIKLLKSENDKADWYIILDKLIKIYKIGNPDIL